MQPVLAMSEEHRSGCPINLALEVFGDRWTLLILRDLMFAGKRHFREFLSSDERISSNILTDRLSMLVEQGIVTRADDPTHKQKAIYSLTETGIALLPVLVQIGIWGRKHRPVDPELAKVSSWLEKGGPRLWDELAAELRRTHVVAPGRQTNREGAKRSSPETPRKSRRPKRPS
jgi:DNA-binding HxlR family transcriptional regulator